MPTVLQIITLLFVFLYHRAIGQVKPGDSNSFVLEKYDTLIHYKDSIIYEYYPSHVETADKQVFHPIHFRMKLPCNLRYQKSSGRSFAFYYDSGETIYVYTGTKTEEQTDTLYKVSMEEQLPDLLYQKFSITDLPGKYSLEKNQFKSNRETYVVNKNGVSIILYNILKNHSALFLRYVLQFQIIKPAQIMVR